MIWRGVVLTGASPHSTSVEGWGTRSDNPPRVTRILLNEHLQRRICAFSYRHESGPAIDTEVHAIYIYIHVPTPYFELYN